MPLTPELTKDFWAYMLHEFGSTAIQKDDAAVMKAAAELLDALHIQDKETFMKSFVTTLYKNIYIPFVIGVEGPDGRWSLWSQVRVCVHENQHVVQANREGLAVFASRYLSSSSYRAGYEAEAFGSDMEMEFWHTGQIFDIPQRASILKSYGCDDADIDMVVEMLTVRSEVVKQGVVETLATQTAIAWLETHVPDLRQISA